MIYIIVGALAGYITAYSVIAATNGVQGRKVTLEESVLLIICSVTGAVAGAIAEYTL